MADLFDCDCCSRKVSKLKRVDDQWKCEWCTGERQDGRDQHFSAKIPDPFGYLNWGGPLVVPKFTPQKVKKP